MKEFKDILSPSGTEVNIIPVLQGDGFMKIDESELPDSLPLLALRNAVLFPGTIYPITIGREKSIKLIEDAEKNNSFIGAVPQNDISVEDPKKEDLYGFGTVAKILKTLEMPDGTITAILQGFKRFSLDAVTEYEPYMLGLVHYLNDTAPDSNDKNVRMIAESLKEKAVTVIKMSSYVPKEAASALKSIESFEFLVNFIATTVEVENFDDKIQLLQYGDIKTRAMKLLAVLDREHKGQVTYHAWESGRQFVFTEEEMLGAEAILPDSTGLSGPCLPVSGYPERDTVLFEPGKAMMKAGAFNLLCSRFGVTKLARFTHLYILPEAETDTPQKTAGIAGFGKLFRIMEIIPLSNAGMKTAAGLYPDADVTARNIPLDSDALKARLYGTKKKSRPGKHDSGDGAITTGGRIHIFGLKYECGGTDRNLLLVTSPVSDTEARTRGWLP